MIDISLHHVSKSFGSREILRDVCFEIRTGERVALLGANGAGKTSLLRIITGALEPDGGEVRLSPGKRVGLISQIPVYPDAYTTEDVLRSAFQRLDDIRSRMCALEAAMQNDVSRSTLSQYDNLSSEYDRLGGYSADYDLERVANGLDISRPMRERLFASLSGGEKTRVNLARLLLEDTDILLLDEPTNHLDLKSTQWLETFLLRFHGAVLTVSHDRWFLDTIAQRTIELTDGTCQFYAGNYSFFVEEKQRRYDTLRRQYEKNQKEIAHLEAAAKDLRLWAFLGNDKLYKRAFSMEKRVERLQSVPKPTKERKLNARFQERAFCGDEVLVAEELSKSFGEKHLFSDLALLIRPGDRVAVMGDNGAGKSTLVKLILGEETPDRGHVRLGPAIRTAYLPQNMSFPHPERTLLDTLLYEDKTQPQEARDRLAAFHFTGEDVFKTVGSLSGGEQSRLRLCMLMKNDINFLILDEPTNHLDIASREWIEQALADYSGTLLFVSHDRWFIERFASRIWELKNGQFTDFPGGYQAFQEYTARQQSLQQIARHKEPKPKATKSGPAPNAARQLAKLEREITKLESSIADIAAQEEAHATDYQKLMALDEEKETLQKALDELYAAWESLEQ